MIRVRFLGTAAARPTVARNVAGIAVQREGRPQTGPMTATSILWDCGEGTQRQIMRYGTGFSFARIFVTHAHADHYLGLPGLLRTMGLQGREEGMTIYSPVGAGDALRTAVHLGAERLAFPVEVKSLRPGDRVGFDGWAVQAFPADHGVPALGYALVEEARPGRFDAEEARRLGVAEGPLFGRLHRGEAVEGADGRRVTPDQVVGPARPGRKVVYTGDSRPTAHAEEMARGADLLVHDATFAAAEAQRARETGHSTTVQAAEAASRAGARRLALTHVSARYSDAPKVLEQEARAVFPGARVAYDGYEVEIPHLD